MRAILLVRVSTTQQEYESQLAQLKGYAESLGYDSFVEICDKESAIKLSEEEREGLNEMKSYIEQGGIDAVFVWEISRLGRTEKVLFSVRDYLIEKGVQLHIFDKRYRLLNEDGTLNEETSILFSLFAYFASTEMKTKKKRFARARERNNEQGKWNGSHIVYGYTTDEDNYIIVDEVAQKIIIELYHKYLEDGVTIADLYRYCNEKGYSFLTKNYVQYLSKMLREKNYIGVNGIVKYPRLMDDGLFNAVQEKLSNIKYYPRKTENVYYGRGIISCPCEGCKRHLSPRLVTASYQCSEHIYDTNININAMDSAIWLCAGASYRTLLVSQFDSDKESFKEEIKSNLERIENLRSLLMGLETKKGRAYKGYVMGKLSDALYEETVKEIDAEGKGYEARISELISRNTMLEGLLEGKFEAVEIESLKTDEERYKIIKEVIEKVEITYKDYNQMLFKVTVKYTVDDKKEMRFKWETKKHKLYLIGSNGYFEIPITKRFERRK